MKTYIYSTLSADQNYDGVIINGGAGVANRRSLITVDGAVTAVTKEQLAKLQQNNVFQSHKRNEFIKLRTKKDEVEKVTKDMKAKDKGAQETEKTLKQKAKAKAAKVK